MGGRLRGSWLDHLPVPAARPAGLGGHPPEQTEWWLGADSAGSLAALTDLLARANQTNQALVEELRRGWVWTGSDWMQPTVAATKPDNHPR